MKFEFGIYSLGERIPNEKGHTKTAQERVENIIQMAKWPNGQMKQDLMYSELVNIIV
ncbi:hypothetical protein [Psychrobacillus glaciei]|uniref:hypothetical protein n=1 Tax=Psychrobacillus glaciei TaxID=2283160 RepID=UPI0029907DA4|nr:hypothetical protein [Psychrobacillus glaciei]